MLGSIHSVSNRFFSLQQKYREFEKGRKRKGKRQIEELPIGKEATLQMDIEIVVTTG